MDHINTPPEIAPVYEEIVQVQGERRHILVVGAADWDVPEAIGRVLLNWWAREGEPEVILLIDNGPVGQFAYTMWQNKTAAIIEPLRTDLRRAERERRQRMLARGIRHAFIFWRGTDQPTMDWLNDLQGQGVPATIMRLDEVES